LGKEKLKSILGKLACYFVTGPEDMFWQYLANCAGQLEEKIDRSNCNRELAGFCASLLGYLSSREEMLLYDRNKHFSRQLSQVLKDETLKRRAEGDIMFSLFLSRLIYLGEIENNNDWDALENILAGNFELLALMILEPASVV